MSIDTDYSVLREVLALKPRNWAIEFGVYSGFSLNIIADEMPVIGLDSFQGLPEDWRDGFPAGKFRLKPGAPLPLTPNALVLDGWFEDTLPFLQSFGLPNFGLVHIDCDLYSSTVTALEGVLPWINPGTYVVFDEYHGYPGSEQHEEKAWLEFCARHMILANTVASGEQERAFVIQSIEGSR